MSDISRWAGFFLAFFLSTSVSACAQGDDSPFEDPDLRQLVRAAADHDRAEVSRLVSKGVDINGQGGLGVAPVHWFVFKKDLEALHIVLEAGADPNIRDEAGWSAMHLASRAENAGFLGVLVAHGADLNAPEGRSNLSPLMIAISGGRSGNVKPLLDLGADVNAHSENGNSAATEAVAFGDYESLEVLLEHGYSFDLPRLLELAKVRRVAEEQKPARQRVIEELQRITSKQGSTELN